MPPEARDFAKGRGGGGRDLDEIVQHVLGADRAYLSRLAWKLGASEAADSEELIRARQASLDALEAGARGNLPTRGPRGGAIWSPHYFVRRVAWHVLDHLWEIEDRVISG